MRRKESFLKYSIFNSKGKRVRVSSNAMYITIPKRVFVDAVGKHVFNQIAKGAGLAQKGKVLLHLCLFKKK